MMKKEGTNSKNEKDYTIGIYTIGLIISILFVTFGEFTCFKSKLKEDIYYFFMSLILGTISLFSGIYAYYKGDRDLGVSGGWIALIIYGVIGIISSIYFLYEIIYH